MADTKDLVVADAVTLGLTASDKSEAIEKLAHTLVAAGRVTDLDGYLKDVQEREAQGPTGLPGGIGIPHCRSKYVTVPSVAVGISDTGVDFGAKDGPAHLIFLIAAPDGQGDAHLAILAALARKLIHDDFIASLRNAASSKEVAAIINKEVKPA